jgi:hypothetical protein
MQTNDSASNPYSPPALAAEHSNLIDAAALSEFARRKRRKLHQILIAMAMLGFAMGLFPEGSTLERIASFVGGLSFTILTLGWCTIDREERNLEPWRFFVPMMVFVPGPILMIPIYLFVTRGLEGFVATAKAFGFFLLMVVVIAVTSIAGLVVTGRV